ncbi:RHS repeat-associated core domain-containing protein [Agrobacterium tumefaciens]|nr:RHS repeat-associated core domain-containing protein [Agrobacterium tumefaciens]NTE18143.1 RHS repeat-associated core domain-containing protein [Agrobacterium tumefaciens]
MKQLMAGFLLLIGIQQASAQLVVSQYNNESEISAPNSVTLVNGFHATGNVRIFTTGVSFRNCDVQVSNLSNDQNYILTRIFREANVNSTNVGTIRGICGENQTIQYFDGLGRPLQTVQLNGTLPGHDLVQPFAYDAFGREATRYQPYSVWQNKGAYRSDAISDGGQASYYTNPPSGIKATGSPFSQTVFEASPLNRVLEQGAPGDAWQPVANSNAGHTMKMEYGTNTNDEVKLWQINSAGNGAVASVYLPGTLYKTINRDENWKADDLKAGTTEEFKDFEGRMVLKRIWESDNKSLSTYYVYDDLGNLQYVLPPAVNENGQNPVSSFDETQDAFNHFIYGYHNDGRKRLIRKKIPGKGWEEMIFNPLDQVVFTQDAIQAQQSERAYVKYDAIGRVIMTGVEYGHTGLRDDVQATVNSLSPFWDSRDNGAGNLHGYNNASAPSYLPNLRPDVINYYDDYDIPGIPANESSSYSIKLNGLLTAQKVRVLGTEDFLWTINYYDDEGRVVKTYKQHYLSGNINASNYDVITNSYSFVGELDSSTRVHYANGATTTIANRYEYDHWGRKMATFENINGQGEVTLNHLEYNEIGQLKNKHLHNNTQHTGFAYNERGWLKTSSSNEFSVELKYNDGTSPQYNGNIANQLYTNGTSNIFTYSYDKLNRLIQSAAASNLGENISYDVMGNISSLSRDGYGTNNYSSYSGNLLKSINGFTNSNYAYDVNGNLISDSGKDIALSYNYLNLPQSVGGSQNLTYTYNGTGEKLKKHSGSIITNYINGIQYTNGVIDFMLTEEGIARNNNGTYSYEYNINDHLGNVRTTFYKNPNTNQLEVLQRDDYYAFGLRKEPVVKAGTNKYLYNGKELQEELGQYDYGARFYDPVIGRWNVVDPLAEDYDDVSPYNYGLNNPVFNIDPDGRGTMGFYNDYQYGQDGKLQTVVINDLPDRFYQVNSTGGVDQLQYGQLTADMKIQYGIKSAELGGEGGIQLGDITINGKKFQRPSPYDPKNVSIPITVPTLGPGLGLVLPEKLIPGTRNVIMVANIIGFALESIQNVNYTPAPKELTGFPTARRVPNKGRARWKTSEGKILEWDSQHGDVEVYDKQGKHQGSANPETGQMTKDPVPGRTTRK